MGIIAKGSINKKLEKIKKKSSWKQFLYLILFQEDFYGLSYNRFTDEKKYRKNKIHVLNNQFNYLILKRLIKESRQSNFLWIESEQFINKFQFVQEILIIIFNFLFTTQSESFIKKRNEWNSNQSIHSTFSFMENGINNSTFCLDLRIPYLFHPEILIRNFRQHISDTSFIHFVRLILHHKENIINLNQHFYLGKNQLYNLLWNFQIQNFEYSVIYMWKQFYNFQSTLFWFFINQINSVEKLKYISKQSDFVQINRNIYNNYSIHYVRYQNKFIISADANLNLFINNWYFLFIFFWEKYFHFWLEPNRLVIRDLSKNYLYFLGYLFRFGGNNQSILIKIQLVNILIDTNLIIKEFCTIIPIVSLIRALAKEKFCDTSGRPICKVSWTTLTDHEIFRRFDQLIKNIFSFYSGCIKRKGLYQLQYILRFSCAKTLACKHKSTIRTVWKKYGSTSIGNSISLKKPESTLWRTYEKKIWYLNIIQINNLASLSHKVKTVQNF